MYARFDVERCVKRHSASVAVLAAAVALSAAWPAAGAGQEGYIDTHMHIDGVYRSNSGGPVTDYETAADNLVAAMDRWGVERALVMPPPQGQGQPRGYDYRALAAALARHEGRLLPVAGGGILNPMIEGTDASRVTDAVRARFEREAEAIAAAGAVGFGETTVLHLCMNPKHHYVTAPADHPLFLLLADIAARHGMPIDVHMDAAPRDMPLPPRLRRACPANPDTITANIPAFERLLAHNRDAAIVWQHIGWDNTGQLTSALLRRLLTAHSNLYLSLRVPVLPPGASAGRTPRNRITNVDGSVRVEWLDLMRDFPDRFMIGADEFIGIPGRTPRRPKSFDDTWRMLQTLPEGLRHAVGTANAARLYGLD